MEQKAGRRGGIEPRQVRAMAVLTLTAVVMTVVLFVAFEPDWLLWLCAGLVVLATSGYWVAYARYRREAR